MKYLGKRGHCLHYTTYFSIKKRGEQYDSTANEKVGMYAGSRIGVCLGQRKQNIASQQALYVCQDFGQIFNAQIIVQTN